MQNYLKHALRARIKECKMPQNTEDSETIVLAQLLNPKNIILGEPNKGVIVGCIVPYPLNPNYTYGTIILSYFEPQHRGIYSIRQTRKFVAMCMMLGADSIVLDDYKINPEVGRIYEKWGFKYCETQYMLIGGHVKCQ